MQKTILIIEDDPKITDLIRLYCEEEGFRVISSKNGSEGLQLALNGNPALIILDRMLPEMEGLEVLKAIRQEKDTPVLLVTAKADEIERVLGLELGADDYISKPFSPKEMMARVKAVLRRSGGSSAKNTAIEHKSLKIDPEKMLVMLKGKERKLSTTEFKLLYLLASHPGRVFSREVLIDHRHKNYIEIVLDRTIDGHIKNIRKKLEDSPKKPTYIESVFGAGYKFKE